MKKYKLTAALTACMIAAAPFRACLESLRARPACIFSAIFREFALQYDSMAAANSLHLAKNLTAQYAHAEILNRLLQRGP